MKHYIAQEKNLSPQPRSKRRIGGAGGGGSSTTVFQMADGMFLSRLYRDIAEGHITFAQGLKTLAALYLGMYEYGLKGGKLTPEGRAELESLWVRSFAKIGDGVAHQDEEGNDVPALAVNGDTTFTGSLSSPGFVSGFLGGQGWGLRKTEYVNSAGVTEYKYTLEVDNAVFRNTLRVFEMIAAQLRGENDNVVFSGCMEIDHYDAETKKLFLKTADGKLYNTFRKGDLVEVHQFNGLPDSTNDYYVTKSYEFRVKEVGIGSLADKENRKDWITFENFSSQMEGMTPERAFREGDTIVRMDSDTDPNRKGVVAIMTVGENMPYIDILYGMKTDPAHAHKGRIGNLEGVRTDNFGNLKGFGIYTNNFYGTGEFHDSQTGEKYNSRISATKTMLTSMYKETAFDISEEDNIIANGFFENGMDKWAPRNIGGGTAEAQGMSEALGSENVPILINGQLVTVRNVQQAAIIEYDSLPMLKLNGMGLSQSFSDMGQVTKHKEPTNPDGSTTEEVSDTLYMGVRILPLTTGELKISFIKSGGSTSGWSKMLSASLEWMLVQEQDSVLSPWDISGSGQFVISYSGECLIRFVALTTDPVASAKADYMTRITQTARIIKAEADAVYSTKTMHAEVSLQVGKLATEVTNNKDASDRALATLGGRIGSFETWENGAATWITQTDSTINLWGAQFDANGQIKKFSGIETDIASIRHTVTDNYNASEAAFKALRDRATALETWENGAATWISQTNSQLNLWATNFNRDGSIKDLSQLRVDVNGLLGTVGSLATTAAMESYVRSLNHSIESVEEDANNNASAISQVKNSIKFIVAQFEDDGSIKTSSKIDIAINSIKQEIVNSLGTVGIYLDGNNMGIRMQADDFSLWDSSGTEKLFGVDGNGVPFFKGNYAGGKLTDTLTAGTNGAYQIQIYTDERIPGYSYPLLHSGIRGVNSGETYFDLTFAGIGTVQSVSPMLKMTNAKSRPQTSTLLPQGIIFKDNQNQTTLVFRIDANSGKINFSGTQSAWYTYSEINDGTHIPGEIYADDNGFLKIKNWVGTK